MYLDLEEYGLIGNLETCALVSREGGIDWLPLPYLESPSVFAAILDDAKGGCCQIRPVNKYASVQRYLPSTNILETTFVTSFGTLVVTDFMPVNDGSLGPELWTILRKVECTQGRIRAEVQFAPRFDYARAAPSLTMEAGRIRANSFSKHRFRWWSPMAPPAAPSNWTRARMTGS